MTIARYFNAGINPRKFRVPQGRLKKHRIEYDDQYLWK
jgi:hypothetical protein